MIVVSFRGSTNYRNWIANLNTLTVCLESRTRSTAYSLDFCAFLCSHGNGLPWPTFFLPLTRIGLPYHKSHFCFTPICLHAHFPCMPLAQMAYPWAPDARVHHGFYSAYVTSFKDVLSARVTELHRLHPDYKVYVTGHSLGAAMATLSAADLSVVSQIPIEGVYTFGSPRVGNLAFMTWFIGNVAKVRGKCWGFDWC